MTALALLFIGAGIVLLFGAVKNVSPIKLVRDAIENDRKATP